MKLNYRRLGRRTLVWLGFGVVVPLLPIIILYAIRFIADGHLPGFFDVLSNGEVLVIATVLTAAAAGELLSHLKKDPKGPGETLVFSGAFIVAVFAAALYGAVAESGPEGNNNAGQHPNSGPAILGIVIFGAALLIGAGTVFVGAWEEDE